MTLPGSNTTIEARVMSTYTQVYYHLVFSTKERAPVLLAENRENLFRYTWGILKNKECHLYRINGVEDHVHILTGIHPSLCVSDLVKEIKISTNKWIKEGAVFPAFTHWQDGYGAFSVSKSQLPEVVEYVTKQRDHHRARTFQEEFRALLERHGIEYDERYVWG